MKLILALLFTLSSITYAAKFTEVDSLRSTKLRKLVTKTEEVESFYNMQDYSVTFYPSSYKIVSRKPSEKIKNTIKQIIYTTNTGWSTPEGVDCEEVNRDGAIQTIKAIENSFVEVYQDEFSNNLMKKARVSFNLLKNEISIGGKKLRFFTIRHGNTFASEFGIAIYNPQTNELLFIEESWSE